MTGADAFLTSYRDRLQGELAGFAERLSDLSSYPFIVTPTGPGPLRSSAAMTATARSRAAA